MDFDSEKLLSDIQNQGLIVPNDLFTKIKKELLKSCVLFNAWKNFQINKV
jgi:hypothetical protein